MEVDRISFYPLLLDILTDISEAHFVAFDLELSGIPTRQPRAGNAAGKQSLQERYLELKAAAERYSILQVGLTCVQQDTTSGKYVLKPYNFTLNPLIKESGLDIERVISYQSGAVDFLLRNRFDMSAPFTSGVPYLSRSESKEARARHAKRNDRAAIEVMNIKPTETESLAFHDRVRDAIAAWKASSMASANSSCINIGPGGTELKATEADEDMPEELSRFEKRLVHQLVRAEYPDLVSVGKRGFVQILRFDKEREDRIAAEKMKELEAKIRRQKGFRWVIEALHGGNLNGLDLRECAKDPVTGQPIFYDMADARLQFHRAHSLIRDKPRMVVGHNCFLDLVYIYHTFIGPLPETVESFQEKIHQLWPMIVDTKYMSTHNCGDINPISSLEQIAYQLSALQTPELEVDKEHKKYEAQEAFHEAGYDSFLTAQVAVRLSSKLDHEGGYSNSAPDDAKGSVDLNETAPSTELADSVADMKLTKRALAAQKFHLANGISPDTVDPATFFIPADVKTRWKRHGEPTLPPPAENDPWAQDLSEQSNDLMGGAEAEAMVGGMPGKRSRFWKVYGNRLRVFGTEESVCVLDGSAIVMEGDGEENGGDVEEGQGGVRLESL